MYLFLLSEWFNRWQMNINVHKTKHDKFSSNANIFRCYCYSKSKLDSPYIGHIISKAFREPGLLKLRLHLANEGAILLAYISIIRFSLEVASVIGHLHQAPLTNMLEAVQNIPFHYIIICTVPKRIRFERTP